MDNKIGLTTIFRNSFLILLCLIIYFQELSSEKFLNLSREFLLPFFLVIFFSFLSVQNFTFAIQNQELKNRIYFLIRNETLSVGDTIKDVTVFDSSSQKHNLEFKDKRGYVIFIMKYGCKPCSENQALWDQINENIKAKKIIIGISIGSPEHANLLKQEYKINYSLFSAYDEEFNQKFKVFSTPQTIVISQNGTTQKVFKGILKHEDVQYLNSL